MRHTQPCPYCTYVCHGQSETVLANVAIYTCDGIRGKILLVFPSGDICTGTWKECKAEAVKRFSIV